MNSDLTFEIDNFRIGTDNQKNVGIYGSFTLNIRNTDGIIVTLEDMRLRKSKDKEEWYVEGPYTEYNKADGTKGKRHHYRVWPDKNNYSKRNPIIDQARDIYSKGGSARKPSTSQQQPAQQASTQTQSTSAPAKATAAAKELW
jgi:hypothetical protein